MAQFRLAALFQLVLLVGVEATTSNFLEKEKGTIPGFYCPNGTGTCGRHIEALVNDGDGLSYQGACFIGSSYVNKIVWDTGSSEMVTMTDLTFSPLAPCMMGYKLGEYGGCYTVETDTCRVPTFMVTPIMYGSGGAIMAASNTTVMLNDGSCAVVETIQEIEVTAIGLLLEGDINVVGGMDPNWANYPNIDIFSSCMGCEADDPALWVWDDYPAEENPLFAAGGWDMGGFACWLVLYPDDPFYWAVPAKSVWVAEKRVGCPNGCAAIIDTGTSFFSLTHTQTSRLEELIGDVECKEEEIGKLSSIVIMMEDGVLMYIAPFEYIRFEYRGDDAQGNKRQESYKPDWFVEQADYWRNRFPNMKLIQERQDEENSCYLAINEPMSESEDEKKDTTLLLGDSFMRGYYWTFDRKKKMVCAAELSRDKLVGLEKDEIQTSEPTSMVETYQGDGKPICQATLKGSTSLLQNDKLIELKQQNKQTAGVNPETSKLEFANPLDPRMKRVPHKQGMRKMYPSKVMMGDAYHMFKRHGSFEAVHKALAARRHALKHGAPKTDLMHGDM